MWVKWHIYMCIACFYLGMLMTNWNSASLHTGEISSNVFGFWIKIIISWVTFILYFWTLIAPRVCPDRDFKV